MKISCLIAFLLFSAAPLLTAAPVTITIPPETATYRAAPGVELAQANCLMCHSADYAAMQPPMPRKFWEANVKKMKEKFGAPTPDAQVAALVDYLTTNYGVPGK